MTASKPRVLKKTPAPHQPSSPHTAPHTPDVAELVDNASSTEAAWWRTAAIAGTAIALALGSLALIWLLAEPLALLIAAIVIAAALAPIVNWLERWMPRVVAVIVLYLALIGIAAGAVWYLAPLLIEQARQFAERIPELVSRGQRWVDRMDPAGSDQLVSSAQDWLGRAANLLIELPMRLFSSVLEIILVLFMSAYWLISGPPLRRFTLGLFPPGRREKTTRTLEAMSASMGGYVRATILNGIIIGIMSYIGLRVIGVDYPIVLALLAGLGELVPIVGPIIASIPAIAVALLESPTQALIVLGFYFALQQFESNLLLPNIMRNQADVPPILSLFAVLAGAALGGLLGAVIAIPVAGALRILVIRVLAPAEHEWVGSDGEPRAS
ncbi:MAG TPA: AI-2E family transporter [Thermomicrobiales bacterium]|nr:AI-2E family transporter [Thermomicrobiales bacterium]